MACEIQTDKYVPFVHMLLKINASVYSNFDNAARFVLKSDLTPEQKKLSIHNLAHIYNGLAGLDKDFWKVGSANDIITASHLLDDNSAYIEFAAKTFGVDAPGKVTLEQVNKAIANLANLKFIRQDEHMTGPTGVFTLFRNFMETNVMTEEEEQKALVNFRLAMQNAIALHTTSQAYNDVLNNALDRFSAKMKTLTPYVALRDIAEAAGLAPILITMADRQVREGYLNDENQPVLQGEIVALKPEQYISYVEALREDNSDHVESNFNEDFFVSNLRIKAANHSKQKEVDDMLNSMENPRSGVRIFAVRLTASDERLQKIKALAAEDPKNAALANRNHETFENNSQIAYLQSNPGSSVIGVSRLTAAEHGFALVGQIVETGELFNLYTLDNYVMINSDNTTTKLDFSNPGHIQVMKRMALKNTSAGALRLTDADIINLQNQLSQFQAFRDGILGDVNDIFDSGYGSVDITKQFFDTFSFSKVKPSANPSMDKALELDKSLGLDLTVVTYDNDGNVVKEEQRKIPFIYTRSSKDKKGFFALKPILASNEAIKVSTIDGDMFYNQQQYMETVLSSMGVTNVDKFIKRELLKSAGERQTKVALRFKEGKPFSYAPVNTKKVFGEISMFGTYIQALAEIISSGDSVKGKNAKLNELSKSLFYFLNGDKMRLDFMFNDMNGLQIKLSPKDAAGPYGVMLNRDNKLLPQFYFGFYPEDQKRLVEMADMFKTKRAAVADAIRETPSLKAYDLSNAEGQADFFRALGELADNFKLGPKGQKLVNEILGAREEFTDMLEDIAHRMEDQTSEVPGFYEQFIEDYGAPERFFYYTDEEGNRVPFINIAAKNESGMARHNGNLRNWTVVKRSAGRMAVVSNGATPMSSSTKTVLDSTPPMPGTVETHTEAITASPLSNPANRSIAERQAEAESKIKRHDLFDGVGEFSSALGGSDKAAVPVSHSEINGIEFVEYAHPITGSIDVIVTGKSDNDFVGFYRLYENGKPTNKWSSKFENQSRNKEDFKTMMSGVQALLPKGHEYTEKTSISTDGLRIWNQQLSKGYELQYDSDNNLITSPVFINGDAIENTLGIPVEKGNFENIKIRTEAEFNHVKSVLLPYLEKFNLGESNIKWVNGSVKIDLPVLKQTKQVNSNQFTSSTTPSSANKKSKFKRSEDAPFKIDDGYTPATDQEILLEASWLAQMLPQFGLDQTTLAEVINLARIDGTVLGAFKDKVIYLNSAMKAKGVVYHEAFHGVFRYLMDNNQRRALLDHVIGQAKYSSHFTKKSLQEFARVRDMQFDEAKIKDLIAEEILADGFQSYMNKKSKPKGIIGQLMEMLKNLLNFFLTNKDLIENTYNDISTGRYKSAVISSELYNGQVAFEIIDGLREIYVDDVGEVSTRPTSLSSYDQNQLVNMMVKQILEDKTKRNFNDKFDVARRNIIDNVYNIDLIIKQNPGREDEIRKAVGNLFSQYRFMLGARNLGIAVADINTTGNSEFDNENDYNEVNGLDNTDGTQSMEQLKAQVKERVGEIVVIGTSANKDIDTEEIEKALSGEKEGIIEDEDQDLKDEVSDDSFDDGMNEFSRLDSIPVQFRKFLATIQRDIFNPELGVTLPHMVDARAMFPVLLKVSANVDPQNIIKHLKMVYEMMREDGYKEAAHDIEAIFNKIKDVTKMDADGNPMNDGQLYNMIVNVLHGSELDYLMATLRNPEPARDDEFVNVNQVEKALETTQFSLVEKIQKEDTNNKRRQLIQGLITTQVASKTNPEYEDAWLDIKRISAEIASASNHILGGMNPTKHLNTLTDELHNALMIVGFALPKSLVKLSILGIEQKENGKPLNVSQEELDKYEVNKSFVDENGYLEKQFFADMMAIADMAIDGKDLKVRLDDENTTSSQIRSFNNILRRASKYIVKYDPTKLPSVIRNAEGKPIYRYVKYTPMLTMTQKIRRQGLSEAVKDDDKKAFDLFLEDFLSNNYMLGDVMRGETTDKAKMVQLFLDNMRVAMFGGAQQVVGGIYKDGKSFKGLDPKSMYIINMLSFMSRSTESGTKVGKSEAANITTYMRSFGQLESSNTNFMITGLYQKYAGAAGMTKNDDKHLKIVDDLVGAIAQEYMRIQKEWAKRDDNKRLYEAGLQNNIIDNYNGGLDTDGKTVVFVDGKGNDLRAFQFNKLADFFNQDEKTKDLGESLREAAKSGIDFDKIAGEDLADLRNALNKYAEAQFDKHIKRLIGLGIVQEHNVGRPGIEGSVQQYLTAELLPDHVKIDFAKQDIVDLYGKQKISRGTIEKDENGKVISRNTYETEESNLKNFLADFFFNNWANALHFNDLFDGDAAMNVKNAVDMVKRNKKWLASGDNGRDGVHTAAVMNMLGGFVHDEYRTKGPYYTEEDINKDLAAGNLTLEEYEEISTGFANAKAGHKDYKDMIRKVFDGQSFSLLMHQMDMHKSRGRLTNEAIEILLASHYRKLTEGEILKLESVKIVNNSKKTITSSRVNYHKMSESLIHRLEVSRLKPEVLKNASEDPKEAEEIVNEVLHDMWRQVYDLRGQYQQALKDGAMEDANAAMSKIQNTVKTIHSFYTPLPHRVALHNILNAMEYHQIDHLMDTEASKNANYLPIDVFANGVNEVKAEGEYLPFNLSATQVKNEYKYSQVETSGVKERSKLSVQAKVLLPADINRLSEIITKANGRTLSETEKKDIDAISEKLLADYDSTLKDSTESRLLYLINIMRKGGDFAIDQVYDIIRENLTLQGASTPLLKMFALKDEIVENPADPANPLKTRVPVYSPNEPQIRKVLQYYFFAQYSKHVTDEKGSGTKSIHLSSFGYNVLVDNETGEIIKTEDYNPAIHTNVSERPLGVTEEPELDVNGKPTGNTVYYVECILPKPLMNNPKALKFYEEHLNRMFATRIPTEDKRSMIALKVVDYIDSSKLNSVIVPQFVHILAGSDFDVDALFMHSFSHYVDITGDNHLYGNYDNYDNARQGKFSEFVHFMMRRGEFSDLISAKEKEIREAGTLEMSTDSNVFKFLKGLGFTEEDFQSVLNLGEINQRYAELDEFIDDITELRAEKREELEQYINDFLKDDVDYGVKGSRRSLEELQRQFKQGKIDRAVEIGGMTEERWNAILEKRELSKEQRRAKTFALAAIKVQAAFEVFGKYNIPTSLTEFEANEDFGKMVVDKFQNQNLQAKLNILTNPVVFNNLYINETSSVERFEQIMGAFGISMDTIASMMNHYTVDAMIDAKAANSMNKDGIGITANINKFLAMCSWYNAELKSPIWTFYKNESDKDMSIYKNFGNLNDENIRTIALIGNILGMFADGAKNPIPSALRMNEENAGITLSMIGLGLSPEFAIGFNFIPEIKNAGDEAMASKYAINDDARMQRLYMTKILRTKIQELVRANPSIAQELADRKLLVPDTKLDNVVLDKSNLVIGFEAQKLDPQKFMDNELTVSEIGYKVSSKVAGTELSDEAQKVVLMKMYLEQSQQSFAIGRAGKLTSLFKAFNPSFAAFDKTKEAIEELFDEERSIFTAETLDKMRTDQVWGILRKMMEDLDHQSSLLFLDRSEFFKPLKSIFDSIFKDKETIAKTVVGFVGLTQLRETFPGSRKASDPVIQEYIDAEDKALLDSFTAEYWWTHNLGEELVKFQQKYPKNRFLQVLREAKGEDKTIIVTPDGKKKRQAMRYIRLINSISLKGSDINDVANDAAVLALDRDGKLFLKKLLYHEYARTGLGHVAGTFMYLLPPEMRKPVSDNIKGFTQVLEEGAKNPDEFNDYMREYLGLSDSSSMEPVYKFFTAMVTQLANAAVKEANNTSIPRMQDVKLNVDKKEGGAYSSAIIKTLKGVETMNMTQTRNVALSVFDSVFGLPSGTISIGSAKSLKFNAKSLGNEFILNMAPGHKNATSATMQVIANNLLGYGSMNSEKSFNFPMVLKVAGGTYILAGVDKTVAAGSIGENVYESIVNEGGLKTIGTVAKYVKMQDKMMGQVLNPAGFDASEIEAFGEITARKGQIVLTEEQAENVKKDTASAKPTTPAPAKKVTAQDLVGTQSEEEEDIDESGMTSDEDLMKLLGNMGVDTSLIPGVVMTQNGETGSNEIRSEYNPNNTPKLPSKTVYDVQEQLKNLDMTPEALQYLYNQVSNPTKSFDQFANEAVQLVTMLRGKTENESILENINCLLR